MSGVDGMAFHRKNTPQCEQEVGILQRFRHHRTSLVAARGKFVTCMVDYAYEWDTALHQDCGDCVNRLAFQVGIEHSAIEVQGA